LLASTNKSYGMILYVYVLFITFMWLFMLCLFYLYYPVISKSSCSPA
jgi:hypothetical protein